jgi:hypothetical protein
MPGRNDAKRERGLEQEPVGPRVLGGLEESAKQDLVAGELPERGNGGVDPADRITRGTIEAAGNRQQPSVSVEKDDVALVEHGTRPGPHDILELQKALLALLGKAGRRDSREGDRGFPELARQQAHVGKKRPGERERPGGREDPPDVVGDGAFREEDGSSDLAGVELRPVAP